MPIMTSLSTRFLGHPRLMNPALGMMVRPGGAGPSANSSMAEAAGRFKRLEEDSPNVSFRAERGISPFLGIQRREIPRFASARGFSAGARNHSSIYLFP